MRTNRIEKNMILVLIITCIIIAGLLISSSMSNFSTKQANAMEFEVTI